jgi:hypothetical protein
LALPAAAAIWRGGLGRSGRWRLLRRLGVVYRRGQEHLHSPDPASAAQRAAVRRARAEARRSGGRVAPVYLDEFASYRRPPAAPCGAAAGGPGPPAEPGHGRNRKRRAIGALDALTGRLTYWQGDKAGVDELGRFYRRRAEAHPGAEVIYAAQDNWPVHFLPGVLRAREGTPIRWLRRPTYAPWTDPIAKVWRKLQQEVLARHDFGDDGAGLRAAAAGWLAAAAPADLLRYTGLRPRRKPMHR